MTKTILITWASTWIGADIALHMAQWNTIIVHYNSSKEKALQVAKDVESKWGRAIPVQADLSTFDWCQTLLNGLNDVPSIDVLVNNAWWLIKRHKVEEITWDLMNQIFALNVFGVMQLTSVLLPKLKAASSPVIINLSSLAARTWAPTATIYGAAKWAVDSFTRWWAKELAPKIRVNAIAPWIILTPFHDKVTSQQQLDSWETGTPLQRHGYAQHISQAVEFLINNDFITWETIDINWGLFMR